jgi:hypothetical protein
MTPQQAADELALTMPGSRRDRLREHAQTLNRVGHDIGSAWMLRAAADIYAEIEEN